MSEETKRFKTDKGVHGAHVMAYHMALYKAHHLLGDMEGAALHWTLYDMVLYRPESWEPHFQYFYDINLTRLKHGVAIP